MGRAKRSMEATSTLARFDAALGGGRRGLQGQVAIGREAEEAPNRTLVSDLHDPDSERAHTAARELAERLRSTGLPPPTTRMQRAVLWAHCVGAMDASAKSALLTGLCQQLRNAGDTEDVTHAITYLAAADWSRGSAPHAGAVTVAVQERLGPNPSLITPELRDRLFDAYSTSPGSAGLAELLAQFSDGDNDLRKRVCELLRSDPSLRNSAPLARAYGPYMRGDYHDEQMLAALTDAHERVGAADAFAPLLDSWTARVRTDKSLNLSQGAFKVMASRWEGHDDGYEELRAVLRERLRAERFPSEARYAVDARGPDGELSALGLEVLATAAARPDAGATRHALGDALSELPDGVRGSTDVVTLTRAFQDDCTPAFYERAQKLGVALIAGREGHGAQAQQHAQAEFLHYRPQVDAIGEHAGAAYANAISEGHPPGPAAAYAVRDDVANFLGTLSATDRRLEGMFRDHDLKDIQRRVGARRLHKAFGDASILSAAYRHLLHERGDHMIGGPESLMDVDIWYVERALEAVLTTPSK